MPWTEMGAVLAIVTCIAGMVYWVLYQKMTTEFDKRYMTEKSCADKHKVTDVMFEGMREDLSEIKDKLGSIYEVIFEAIKRTH